MHARGRVWGNAICIYVPPVSLGSVATVSTSVLMVLRVDVGFA